jgi:hypothetical protein
MLRPFRCAPWLVRRSALLLLVASIVLVALRPTSVDASTVLKMRIEDLAARCEIALVARVTSSSASIDATGHIATDYALDVERTLVGTHAAHRTIRIPGGVLADGRGMVIPGMPTLAVGERAILFLSESNVRGERLPIGLAQGRMRIVSALDGTLSVVCETSDLELVDESGHPLPASGPSTLPYAPTLQRIEAECARRPKKHAPLEEKAREDKRGGGR